MSPVGRRLAYSGLVVAIVALLAIVPFLELPSEITTLGLLGLLGGLVLLSGLLIWVGLLFIKSPHRRFALAGLGLLAIGTVLALAILPESSTGVLSGGVGVLPPFPAKKDPGFVVGLAAHPEGCRDPVPITFVIAGSRRYWEEHESNRRVALPFVLILPGRYEHLKVGLGPERSEVAADPQEAEVESRAASQLRDLRVIPPGDDANRRALTVVTAKIAGWAATRRPVIVEARAGWITHRGLSNCNLELPALSGGQSAAALVSALECSGLDEYAVGSCTPAGGAIGGITNVSRSLEVRKAVTVVTGNVSTSDSDPQPTSVNGTPEWRCESPSAITPLQLSGGLHGAQALVAGQGDCHASATVVASTWHRDFLLVLIGAFIAVGVHMMFQAMVEARIASRKSRHTASSPAA